MLTSRSIAAASWLWLVGSLAAPIPSSGQPPPGGAAESTSAAASPDDERDHEALRALRAAYERAITENQLDLLAPHLHPDFFGVMITGESVESLEDMRRYWSRIRALMGEGGRYTTTMNPERSVILGDLALARGTTDDLVVTGEGREYRFNTAWMAVLQRVDGQWKVLRAQGTMDPVSNAFVTSFARRAVVQASAIAAAAGIVLGWLFAVLYRRMRSRRA